MSDDADISLDGRPLTQRELLITINGKMDVFVAELKAAGTQLTDHESRIRGIEASHYVTWRQFWAGVVGAAAIAGSLATFLPYVHLS